MIILVIAMWAFAILILSAVLYHAIFAAAYLLIPSNVAGCRPDRQRRFVVVIPAHDEELLVADVIDSIRDTDYPSELLHIHVIADNCSDRTAEIARARGVNVAERNEPNNRGKGQALQWMFQRLDFSRADAIALFDADNRVEPNFFSAMNREIERGARCLQGYYGMSNPDDTVLTRLLAVTYVMKNLLFNGGKAKLGLSVVLGGTGMVFVREVIEQNGWEAMTIGEDLEQTFNLVDQGERIRFVSDARTQAQESSTLRQGYTQRQRWATGRRVLAGRARHAVLEGFRQRSIELADVGIDLLMPSYSKLMNWTVVALVLAVVLFPWSPWLLPVMGAALAYQVLEIAIGLRLMRASPAYVSSLLFAPVFLGWKAVVDILALVGYRRDAWTRTARTPHADDSALEGALRRDDADSGTSDDRAQG